MAASADVSTVVATGAAVLSASASRVTGSGAPAVAVVVAVDDALDRSARGWALPVHCVVNEGASGFDGVTTQLRTTRTLTIIVALDRPCAYAPDVSARMPTTAANEIARMNTGS